MYFLVWKLPPPPKKLFQKVIFWKGKSSLKIFTTGLLRNRWKTHVRKCTGSEPVSSKLEEVSDHLNILTIIPSAIGITLIQLNRSYFVRMHPCRSASQFAFLLGPVRDGVTTVPIIIVIII